MNTSQGELKDFTYVMIIGNFGANFAVVVLIASTKSAAVTSLSGSHCISIVLLVCKRVRHGLTREKRTTLVMRINADISRFETDTKGLKIEYMV
jgi:hypothetical protein